MRIAVIGAGLMGSWHAFTAKRLGAKLVAVLDTDAAAAARLSRRHPGADTFGDMAEMLRAARPDAVHICSPLASHGPLAMEAISHGVHALVEKPFARSVTETGAITEAAAKAGVIVCPVHQFVFQDGVRRARACLPALGEVSQIECTIASAGGIGMSEASREALIGDILPHPLSLLRALWPDAPVAALDWHVIHPRRGELLAVADCGGAAVHLSISLSARPTRCEFAVLASRGSIHLDLFHGYAVVESGKVSRGRKITRPFTFAGKSLLAAAWNLARRTAHNEPAYPGLRNLMRDFYAAIRDEGDAPLEAQHILDVAVARERLLEAAAAGTPVLQSAGSGG